MVRRLISPFPWVIVLAGSRRIIDMQIHSVGIDLGKTTFHLVALSASGKVLLRKKFTQRQLITFAANMQCSLNPGSVREAVREVEQERLPRCRGHRRGCRP